MLGYYITSPIKFRGHKLTAFEVYGRKKFPLEKTSRLYIKFQTKSNAGKRSVTEIGGEPADLLYLITLVQQTVIQETIRIATK